MSEQDLPTCAYCGCTAKPIFKERVSDGKTLWSVECNNEEENEFGDFVCLNRAPTFKTKSEAIASWRRVNDPVAEVERLTLAIERLRVRFGGGAWLH